MGQQPENLRYRILILCGVTLALMFLTLVLMMSLSWRDFLQNVQRENSREAITASTLVQGTLVDASKILDVAKTEIEKSLEHGSINEKASHDILHKAVQNFSIYNTQDAFGLLLLLDDQGQLLARSGEYPTRRIDLSDRNYYLNLRDDRAKEFSLGKLRKAATTGKVVFHLSMPVHGPGGTFAGVVVIQIDEMELASKLTGMLTTYPDRKIHLVSSDTNTLLVYPASNDPLTTENPSNLTLQTLSRKSPSPRGSITIQSGTPGFPDTCYASFDRDPLFGFTSWACVLKSDIRDLFLKQNRGAITLSCLATLGITALFIGLYRQARRLEKALHQATTDPATGLPNRRALEIQATALWSDASRHGRPITAVFLDIDRFKSFNDAWGHHTGDRVIKLLAGLLRKCADRPHDFFCRWGGEEFLILLPETGIQGGIALARRIRRSLSGVHLENGGGKLPSVTISVGIASTEQQPSNSLQELIERADLRMLEAKSSGRDRIIAEGVDLQPLETQDRSPWEAPFTASSG